MATTKEWAFRVNDWVEVRSKAEILKTLDRDGRLDGLPFMPEMFRFCGQRFRVVKRAHKTCDTVFPVRERRMENTVHLETRCDGQAHGGCEAACMIFWKEAWLKRVDVASVQAPGTAEGCTEEDVYNAAKAPANGYDMENCVYTCQATQLPTASTALSPWDIRQYVEDYTSGNVALGTMFRGFLFMAYDFFASAKTGIGVGRALRWLYDATRKIRSGYPYPIKSGLIPFGKTTPVTSLDLQPGEWVRIKSHREILATCDTGLRNRGLHFDAEMVPYCGGTYRVHKRVTKIINERTGKMQPMKTPSIILEGVVCKARYSGCRLFCPRMIYSYWREIWLERVFDRPGVQNGKAEAAPRSQTMATLGERA